MTKLVIAALILSGCVRPGSIRYRRYEDCVLRQSSAGAITEEQRQFLFKGCAEIYHIEEDQDRILK